MADNKLNCLSATTATSSRRAEMVSFVPVKIPAQDSSSSTSSDDSGSYSWIEKSSSSDRYDSSSEDEMSRQFTAPEARDFIVSKLRDRERFEDYLNRFVEWDNTDGLNEKADLTAMVTSCVR